VNRVTTKNRGQSSERQEFSGDGDVYDAWTQALSSADQLCHEATVHPAPNQRDFEVFTAVIPIVVVADKALWAIEYDMAGKVAADPMQLDFCTLFLGHRVKLHRYIGGNSQGRVNLSHVHFLTLFGLKSFAKELGRWTPERREGLEDISTWGQWFPDIPSRHLAV